MSDIEDALILGFLGLCAGFFIGMLATAASTQQHTEYHKDSNGILCQAQHAGLESNDGICSQVWVWAK